MKYYQLKELCIDIVDCPHSTPKWQKSGFRVVRNFNLKDGNIDFSDGFFVDEETYNERTKRAKPETGDIIISREAPMGTVGIIPDDVICCLGQRLVLLKVDKNKCNPYYLLCALMSDFVQTQFERSNATGSIVSNLCIPDLEKIIIPVVDVGQDSIANIFKSLNQIINNNNKINAELESLAKTIYDYWFLQYEFPNEEGKPYKSSGGKMVWNEELKREIPEIWHILELGELFVTNRGVSYNSKTLEGNGVPMINLASFSPQNEYNVDGIKNYSGDYTDEKIVKPYSLIMCNTQQTAIDFSKDIIGRAMLVPDIFNGQDIVTSHHVNTINTKSDELKFFLLYLFNTDYFHKYIVGFANGTNILGLTFSGVEKYKTEIPDSVTLKKFSDIAQEIEIKKSQIIKENQELTSLRDWLLPLLINGQVGFCD